MKTFDLSTIPEGMNRVVALRDESGHWYVIPKELQTDFDNLVYNEEDEVEFTAKFSKYMTGGDINNVLLYAIIAE